MTRFEYYAKMAAEEEKQLQEDKATFDAMSGLYVEED